METAYRLCPQCGEEMDPEWAGSNQRFCSRRCKNAWHYANNLKPYHQKKYAKLKKQWERSPNGKRAGIPIRQWLQLPLDWR